MRGKNFWKPIFLLSAFFTLSLPVFIPNISKFTLINNSTKKITTPTPPLALPPPPAQYIIPQKLQVYQTFNNCGPASLSMLLSYFGIEKSQEELGKRLRPYQNPWGDNDDKSVTLDELASLGKEFNLLPYHRPNGNIKLLQQFIANEIPVITRALLNKNEDIGHYRIVRGYDNEKQILIQDDSLQGENLKYSYEEFNLLWKNFNYEYFVLVPESKKPLAEKIIGDNKDKNTAWKKAVSNAEDTLKKNPDDIFARFNLSVALYHTDEFEQSVLEYEKVSQNLPFRTLWYQIEPIQAYFKLGKYDQVFFLTDNILSGGNRAFSELYLLRSKIYQKQGKTYLAQEELQKAVLYNQNLKDANTLVD